MNNFNLVRGLTLVGYRLSLFRTKLRPMAHRGFVAMPDPEMPKAAFGFPWRPSETLS